MPSDVQALVAQAQALDARGAYGEAAELWRRVAHRTEQTQGSAHPDTATALNHLGEALYHKGTYAEALVAFERALHIRERRLGPRHPDTATSLQNLAALHEQQAAYGKAEALYRRALEIQEATLGAQDLATATTLNNLGGLSRRQGATAKAESFYKRALAIVERQLGPKDPHTADTLHNLASLYASEGQSAKAEPLFLRVVAISEATLGPNHPETATSLNALALLYDRKGEISKAEPLYRRSLAIREQVLGSGHPDTGAALNNLALCLTSQRRFKEAEPLVRHALEIKERSLGPNHLGTARSLNTLAGLLLSQGADQAAEPLLRRSISIEVSFLQRELPLLAEDQRQRQVQSLERTWEATYGLAARSPTGASLALFTRLNRHGLLQDIERRQALLARAPGPQRDLSRQIASLTARLSAVDLPRAQRQALQEQRQQLEQQLYRQLPALQPRLVAPEAVAKALPADGALIEFQRYRPFLGLNGKATPWGEPRYLGLVLHPSGSITATDLGPANPLDALIREALAVSEKGERPADPLWQQVSNKVLAPLLPQLQGRRRWFLSPDGEFNRIPYSALPFHGQPSQRLVQAVQLRLLTSGRDLLPSDPAPAAEGALVVAGPDFGGARPWAALPAAAQEGKEVAEQLQARLIEGPNATATALGRARGPKVLHVASHGFFLPAAAGGDPLLDSGLVLAGANRSGLPNQPQLKPAAAPRSGKPSAAPPTARQGSGAGDDGYLTAKEAAQLQLDGTELVVLSACDTGSGIVQGGEGVYGLQRALTVAGARSTLLSLWKVDDVATSRFMRRFYDLLKAGKGRMDALVQAQEEFRSNPPVREWRDHRYWAAWQLSGVTAPLPGL